MKLIEANFEKELEEEIALLPIIELKANSVVLIENAYVKNIPILLEGSIKVRKTDESGKEIILYQIYPGESCILSIISCLNDKQCNAEAYVEKTSKLIMVPASKVKLWMEKYSSWKQYVFNHYYNKFDELITLIDAIAFKHVDIRLLNKLKEYQIKQGNKIVITHQTLANEIGTAREVISRLLKQLEKENFVKLERGTIKIIRTL
ncbi:MAG: Crp/Fnr family transcriptional regulator [Lutibacter sp.]|jgi:CRP/FNR family transcriptional regulator|nr:Crp/Fnr family transcriptional regulator [Lutibacter sp.]